MTGQKWWIGAAVPWLNHTVWAQQLKHENRIREPRKPIIPPTWWILGHCTEESCVDERIKRLARGQSNKPEALCQICRLCRAHCLGHRGIMEGLRPFLTVHNYG